MIKKLLALIALIILMFAPAVSAAEITPSEDDYNISSTSEFAESMVLAGVEADEDSLAPTGQNAGLYALIAIILFAGSLVSIRYSFRASRVEK